MRWTADASCLLRRMAFVVQFPSLDPEPARAFFCRGYSAFSADGFSGRSVCRICVRGLRGSISCRRWCAIG